MRKIIKNFNLEKIIEIILIISLGVLFFGKYNRFLQYVIILLGIGSVFKYGYKKTNLELPVVVFFLGISFSIINALDSKHSFNSVYRLFYPLMVFISITQMKIEEKSKDRILKFTTLPIALYFVINIGLQIFKMIPLYWKDEIDYTKYLVFRDSYDFIIAAITIYFLSKLVQSKENKNKIFWSLWSSGGLFLIIASKTKSSWLGIVFAIFVIVLKSLSNIRIKIDKKLLFKLISGILGVFFLIVTTKLGREHVRVLKRAFDVTNMSNSSRIDVWLKGYDFFKEKPWFGYGFEPFFKLPNFEEYHWMWHFHNEYVELIIGTGIIGLIGYFIMNICIIKKLLNLKTVTARLALGFIAWGSIYHIATTDINSMIWWGIWSIVIGLGVNQNGK